MTKAQPTQSRLSLSTILAFAATSLPLSSVAIALSVYLPNHYASHVGVPLAVVGSAFMIVRLIDIPIDGVLGWAMDRTRSRWGRYRLWTVLGGPPLMLALYFLFMPPPGAGMAWLIGFLLLMYLGTSILSLSHSAWAATLAPRYNDRSRVFGVMTAVGVLGAGTVLIIPRLVESQGMPESSIVEAMGWFILVLIPIAIALVVWRTPEKIAPEVHGQRFRLRDYWALVARPSMARILACDLLLTLGPGWMSALYIFYFTQSRQYTPGVASLLLLVYILAGFAGAPLMGRLAMRISKHRAVMVATTGYSLSLVALLLIPKGNIPVGAIQMFTAGFLAAGFTVLTRAMTADIADEVRLEKGAERSGLLFAMTTMTSKIAGAFAIGLTFLVLDRVGFIAQRGVENTPEAIRALEWVFLLGPIVFVMAGGACMLGYKLGEDAHGEIRRQLDERDALYDEAPIIESVTTEAAIAVEPGKP